MVPHHPRREFVAAQKMVQVEVEDCASTSTKIDAVAVLVQNVTIAPFNSVCGCFGSAGASELVINVTRSAFTRGSYKSPHNLTC